MGAGFIIFPFILLIFYIIPILLFFKKSIKKNTRYALLSIPIFFTGLFSIVLISDNERTEKNYQRFPQTNNISFINSTKEIKDSILQLQNIMNKLPKRLDQNSVTYTLDKHPERHYSFTFNWYEIGNLQNLELGDNLRIFEISQQHLADWSKYVGNDITPFDTLSKDECLRFINLIKFLDRNNLNAASLTKNIILFDYNDSLSMSHNLGSRKITLDTSGYYAPDFFDIIDSIDGFFLLRRK